jgi:tetratricopeptide (TPR) repeat protein
MDDRYLKAEALFNAGNLQEAVEILNEILKSDNRNTGSLLLRGNIYYRQQKWGDALNDLNLILETEPDHQVAKNYKSMIMNIISFWNKDSCNP